MKFSKGDLVSVKEYFYSFSFLKDEKTHTVDNIEVRNTVYEIIDCGFTQVSVKRLHTTEAQCYKVLSIEDIKLATPHEIAAFMVWVTSSCNH